MGCADVVPSDLVTEILGVATPGAWESGSGDMTACRLFSVGAESEVRTTVAARQGSAEVWLQWRIGPHNIKAAKDELFAAIFERLG